ncbi:UDP-N-acetylmuramoylalanine--D-glutamate ligase [Thermovirga lienii DSM 17291]|uniref:UDP-N-acetylmuramoylalanine--D-glutamate ligase n=1 Tax=Thermovirga lienii (strain ATCC BAA-1197 / DSM 17291 / Cas60314) TaxID=580340 RepID=G7VA09_THELD|nr:UDP-N-acetylmuramoyl-L-alanine--D-glutamate ligase [Thermovirga lienii]AER66709.1 UDP-N-acetylmuramoylalanine--D-glutamate ligase [Thermovirga lienii DSM 17291]
MENKKLNGLHEGCKLTIIGAGVSGRALASLAVRLGFSVFVTDKAEINPKTKEIIKRYGIEYEERGHTEKALEADALVLSSGISPRAPIIEGALKRGIPVVGELDFVFPHLKSKVIGVTGTNGKTTTTSLIAHLLTNGGFEAEAVGNIGNALADYAFSDHEWLVVEVSSFQLYWSQYASFDISVITNIAPDHLDWHGSYEEYFASKTKIFNLTSDNGIGICQARDVEEIKKQLNRPLKIIPFVDNKNKVVDWPEGIYFEDGQCVLRDDSKIRLFDVSNVHLIGTHNLENAAMSAVVAYYSGLDPQVIEEGIDSFKALPHRCEEVANKNGIRYVNDSKGTNVSSTVAALNSIEGKKIIILGGKGKGEDYGPLAEAVKEHTEAAILMGEEKIKIAEALSRKGYTNFHLANSMEEAVEKAVSLASPGCTVLLSPACTSWDMYENYKARGEHFRKVVNELTD